MDRFFEQLHQQRILPLIQSDSVADGLAIAQAMEQAGIQLVEIVLRTSASLQLLATLKREMPQLQVGAGTLLNSAMVVDALNAGADFLVTPATTAKLLETLCQTRLPCLPGVATPSEIALCREAGFLQQKLFPASTVGGVAFLNAVRPVFSDVTFCPTGGINAANFVEYAVLENVLAVGGSWLAPADAVHSKDWSRVTCACEDARQLIQQAS